jgi:hypothetical protein
VSVEKRTVFSIEIVRERLPRLGFLANLPGFDNGESHTDDLPDHQNYVMYTAIYNRHFSYREERRIKKIIGKHGGAVTTLHLGKGPMLSKDSKDMLIDCSIMAAVAFFSGLVSANFLSSGKGIEALGVGLITAVTTFFTELAIERKFRRGQEKAKSKR